MSTVAGAPPTLPATPPADAAAGGAASGWQSFYDSRVEMRDSAQSAELKAHFDAELEVARQTMAAMGVQVEGGSPSDKASVDGASGAPGDAVPEFPPYTDETTGAPKKPDDAPASGGPAVPGDSGTTDGTPPVTKTDVKGVPGPTGGEGKVPAELEKFSAEILAASEATGVPVNVLCAVIWDESKGDAGATSTNQGNGGTDAGLMQVNPETFKTLMAEHPERFTSSNLNDVATNVMAGASYLKEQYEAFGDWDVAFRAYNSGPLNVNPNDLSDISKYGTGTVTYVDKINYFMDIIDKGEPLPLSGYPGGNGNW